MNVDLGIGCSHYCTDGTFGFRVAASLTISSAHYPTVLTVRRSVHGVRVLVVLQHFESEHSFYPMGLAQFTKSLPYLGWDILLKDHPKVFTEGCNFGRFAQDSCHSVTS